MSFGYDGSSSSSGNSLRIYSATDTSLVTFQNGGNVGIGTSSPATVLHVRDALDTEVSLESTAMSSDERRRQSSRVAGAATDASFQIVDRTSGGSRYYIGTNGFVGVGTTGPTNRLHGSGGVSATVFVATSDRNAKENFASASPKDVLEKSRQLSDSDPEIQSDA